jgi:hypothetical protein
MAATETNSDKYELRQRMLLWLPALYYFVIFLAGIYSFRKPEYNWDMLPYMALVLESDNIKTDSVHDQTYYFVKQSLPPASYKNLTDSSNTYRKQMKQDRVAFHNQLPLYVVKPLYIAFVYLFYKAGFSLSVSTIMPSIFSYLLIGFLFLHWLKKYLNIVFASWLSLLVMLSTPMLGVAKLSTPDGLSALLVFSLFYFVIEKRNALLILIFMAGSVFARIDNIITCLALIGFLVFQNKPLKKMAIVQYWGMIAILVVCYFSITASATKYGWSIFYYNSFSNYVSLSYGSHSAFVAKEYLRLMFGNAINSLYHSQIITFLGMVLSLFIGRTTSVFEDLGFDQIFSLLLVLIITVRFLLYPDIGDRSYIPYYLIVLIFIARRLSGKEEFLSAKT